MIGGFTEPKGSREHFGALLVGYYEGDRLRFASKVGTGFNSETLLSLNTRFKKLVTEECPFANLPEKNSVRGGLTAGEMRKCTWVKPEMICQIHFTEWTRDGHLRHPAFIGLREDKNPLEVGREGVRTK